MRVSGVLLHPTSLPGRYGLGDLGDAAFRFADFLEAAGQGLWQVLPLGPTGYGDSPYQCFSAFAGNPLLVSLERLVDEGWLSADDLARAPSFPETEVDFGAVIGFRLPLLDRAAENFQARAKDDERREFELFRQRHSGWLADYALFMALKHAHDGAVWTRWDKPLALHDGAALDAWRAAHAGEIASREFAQFQFFRQWSGLRAYCHHRGIRIMGDVPIFVAHDSADVWAHRDLFQLEADGERTVIAGVPPDYFSATGQCWGNPLYRWEVMANKHYQWWIERFRSALSLVDLVRLDHFRGFEAYWEIPGSETTAVKGRWVKGPGALLFQALRRGLGQLPIVAENLGVITPEVEALRQKFGFPGMAILQFAFGTDPQGPGFRPYNYTPDLVAYTGTHDNDTTVGWWTAGVGDSTRTEADVEAERSFAREYFGTDGTQIHWDFIRAILGSVADTAITPVQDLLGLGNVARMNLPGRASGNWRFRYRAGALDDEIRDRLLGMTTVFGRRAKPEAQK
jgi:4-alpha-glucanotransferase